MPDNFQANLPRWSAEQPSAYDRYSEVNFQRPPRRRPGAPLAIILAVTAFLGMGVLAVFAFGILMWQSAPMPARPTIGFISSGPPAFAPAGNADAMALEGIWVATAAVIDGDQAPENEVANIRLTMDQTGFKLVLPTTQKKGRSWTIKSDDDPKEDADVAIEKIDFLLDDGSVLQGIFKIDGDTMKLCLSTGNEPRPTDFDAEQYSQRIQLTLKRQKPPPRKC
jgi:uncharacterized protein (TIGR03067 family)